MEIYIKVEPLEGGKNGWYADEEDTGCGSCIVDGDELLTTDDYGYDVTRGSAAKSWAQAKSWAKVARMLANWDYGKARITFWSFRRGKLVKVTNR